jgi:hypothetical protein
MGTSLTKALFGRALRCVADFNEENPPAIDLTRELARRERIAGKGLQRERYDL